MRGRASDVRPATHRLEALIRKTVAQLRHQLGDRARDTVLCLGQRHQAFPTLVVEDPVLEPVDKIIWMVIWQQGGATGTSAPFPSYAEIAFKANVASCTTIGRALAILRATRWLSLCARIRGTNGRFHGNVYALHDEPLPLRDSLQLDRDYLRFLERAKRHHHARVRTVAAGVLASLDEDIRTGIDVTAPISAIERRLQAWEVATRRGAGRYFSFTPTVLSTLSNAITPTTPDDQHQNLATDADRRQNLSPQILKTVCSCSKNININTTTTTPARMNGTDLALGAAPALVYPPKLSDNQRGLAVRYLAQIPAAQRQAVLDELAGRLQAARQGAKPLYDELRYLHRLCQQVRCGGFEFNLGHKVQAERALQREATERARQTLPVATPVESPAARVERPAGEDPVAAIRAKFNLPSRLKGEV